MASTYTIYFTDTDKTPFTIQPYTANGPVSPSDPTIIVSASSASTTLKLYGRGAQDFGEGIAQDMVYMLENFSNASAPVNASEGQIWYKNSVGVGSPPVGVGSPLVAVNKELFIYDSVSWGGIILATGSSAMTGELTLAGNPTNPNHAVPLAFLSGHNNDLDLHLTPVQNTYLDGLLLTGSPAGLTFNDTNQLSGIISNVQGQFDLITGTTLPALQTLLQNDIDTKVSIITNTTMNTNTSISFDGIGGITGAGTGTIKYLPLPLLAGDAASKQYVDDQLGGITTADGVLTSTSWSAVITGGQPTVPVVTDTTLELIVSVPNTPPVIIYAEGIARTNHTHDAPAISIDYNGSPVTVLDPIKYGLDTQSALEYVELNKADLKAPTFTSTVTITGILTVGDANFTGTVTASEPINTNDVATKSYVDSVSGGGTTLPPTAAAPTRQFNVLATELTLGSPLSTFVVKKHKADDNTLSITVNGIKQYLATRGTQLISYYAEQTTIAGGTPTGLIPNSPNPYDFNISIDGAAPTTIVIPSSDNYSTHSALANSITNALAAVGAAADFQIINNGEMFTSGTQGSSSNIIISDSGLANNIYLFEADLTPGAIVSGTFLSEPSIPTSVGSPVATPDSIEISGDVTARFPIGRQFIIRGSDEPNYGTYDNAYSVHDNGATFNGTNTIIPIALLTASGSNIPLLPPYDPLFAGSPAPIPPAPAPWGTVYVSPLTGFKGLETPVNGLAGDYIETDVSGNQILRNTTTVDVLFNYTIPAGSSIESLSFG